MPARPGPSTFTRDYRLAARKRDDLVLARGTAARSPTRSNEPTQRLFGRSLCLRQVSAGGCNACEADTNVLTTIGWDIGRFGIQFVASPRHADGLLVTGPVSKNMELALEKTWEAVAVPEDRDRRRRLRDLRRTVPRAARKRSTARRRRCRWTSSCRAARRTRSRSSTASSGCWGGSADAPAFDSVAAHRAAR